MTITEQDDPWERAPAARIAGAKRVLNVPADVFDERDLIYQPRPAPLLPIMLRPPTPIRDQQTEGTCTGCALATVVDIQLLRRADRAPVSARFLYENAKKYDEWKGEEYEGSSIRGAMKGLWYHGVCAELILPYRVGERWERLPSEAFANADVRPLGAYYRVPTSEIPALQGAIAEAGAVLASAQVHEGWNEPVLGEDGVAEIVWREQPAQGGHAFALVGFDERGFLVQNSWGAAWGTEGCARLTYEDWLAHRQDAWVAQVGLGRAALLRPEQRTVVTVEGEVVARVREEDIEGHYLSIRNGRWETRGTLRSFESDLPQLIARIRKFGETRGLQTIPVLLYAHGGLVSAQAAAEKTLDFKEVMKANGIYPVPRDLADRLSGRGRRSRLASRAAARSAPDLLVLGAQRRRDRGAGARARQGAVAADARGRDHGGARTAPRRQWSGRPVSSRAQGCGAAVRASLVGPQRGFAAARRNCRLVRQAPAVSIASMAYLAPAITTERFRAKVVPLVESLRVQRFALWTMLDGDERDDHCARLYRKSLLYLVSQAFEPEVNTRLLGLARHIDRDWQGKDGDADPRLALWLRQRKLVRWCRPRAVESTLHGSYDDDPAAVNAWLAWALESAPARPYARRRK